MRSEFVLAADIGGSHITAALIDMQERKMVSSSLLRRPVDANGASDDIITAWSECLLAAKDSIDVSKICLAMPGPFDYEKGISLIKDQGKYQALYSLDVKDLLAQALHTGADQIFMENDAACFLQGEVFAGCANGGFQKVIGITLGTGLGTAVYKDGKSRSADLWSLPFKESIAEDYLSTQWFLKRYTELSNYTISGVKELAQQSTINPLAHTIFQEFGKNLAAFLKEFIQQENPEVVVIGGNIANAYNLFQGELESFITKEFPTVQIKKSVLGEEAALLGAAGSWHSEIQKALSYSQS